MNKNILKNRKAILSAALVIAATASAFAQGNGIAGINDIGAAKSGNSETVARQIIESIQGMMKKAKARKMKVYLGTITPFKGAGYYSHFHEAARLYVNDWIRNQAKNVDGILDFAKLLQDPNDDRRMKREYASNDWLHPNPAGYKAMGIYAADIIK